MNGSEDKNKGFIQIIIIVALLVVILSLLGISLSSLFANPVLQDNFGFLGKWIADIWNAYLGVIFNYLWNTLVAPLWQAFLNAMKGLNPFNQLQ